MRVPEFVDRPQCPCGGGDRQTVEHLLTECTDRRSRALRALGLRSTADVWRALGQAHLTRRIAQQLLESSWLPEYDLSESLRMQAEVEAQEALEASAAA